jgi:plastocyanin
MRTLLISLTVFALGLGGAFFAFSPRAGAQSLTTINGSVGTSGNHDAYNIALGATTLAPGAYEFDITDYSSIHNFDLCKGTSCTGTNSVDKTGVSGTGAVAWNVNLTPGKYTYQCDVHTSDMQGQFTVTGGTTSTTTTTTKAMGVTITKVVAKRPLFTVTAKANQATKFTGWILKSGKIKATISTTVNAVTATLKLKPAKALVSGYYIVQVRAGTGTNTKTVKKQVYVS